MRSIILPIKSKYVKLILQGSKRYEFRKRACKSPINKIYIYETAPKKKIVAEVLISQILEGTPEYIWNICSKYSGMKKEQYDKYYSNSQKAIAYKISEVKEFEFPKELSDYGIEYVPQSFVYVD